MQFQKLPQVEHQKRSFIIAENIVQRIRDNQLQAAVKLPSELAIAEQLGAAAPRCGKRPVCCRSSQF